MHVLASVNANQQLLGVPLAGLRAISFWIIRLNFYFDLEPN